MQEEITLKCYRYIKIVNPKKNYYDFYQEIWAPNFDPNNPDSGWGRRTHKTIFPLTGINSDILPDKAKGYLMDSTCNADPWDGNAFSPTFIGLHSNKVKNNDIIELSVFCFVSDDFNGDWVCIVLTNNDGPWIDYNYYDMGKKGTWQKLIVRKTVSSGFVSRILYFSKSGVKNFSSLKGYVIFAYPEFSTVNNNDTVKAYIEPSLLEQNSSINICKRNNLSNVTVNKELINYTKNIRQIDYLIPSKYISSSFTFFPLFSENINYNLRSDKDPIRNWVAKFISEDTTYYPCKSNITAIKEVSEFGTDRTSRWQFALQIFNKEYSWKQKIFGGGFAFLNWYGYYFLGDKTKSDYPHNPFLYILLYSGIIGLFLYIYLLYKVFFYYIKYIKEYYIFFIFFLITYFFIFFGGGDPFNPPIMGFFMMLPFFIHYIHGKESIKKEV
jgi:hypothetical protein